MPADTIDPAVTDFPAAFSAPILAVIADEIAKRQPGIHSVLDPFAGVGGVHKLREVHGLPVETVGVELEPEWADAHPRNRRGNALHLERVRIVASRAPFDAIVTSPTYGNRMADSHNAQDACGHCDGDGTAPDGEPCVPCRGLGLSRRHTYTHRLGRPLTADNSGGMQWGYEYRAFHEAAWRSAVDALKPAPGGEGYSYPGWFFLNISDHIRGGDRQDVVAFHLRTLQALGLVVDAVIPVGTRRQRYGANAAQRVDAELVIVLRKGGGPVAIGS